MRAGLVEQELETGKYGPGPLAIPLALNRLRTANVVSASGPYLRRLRNQTKESVLFTLWSERGPIVIRIEESSRPVFLNIRVGSVLPIYTSATGQVFAAHLPTAQSEDIEPAPRWWTSQETEELRTEGFAAITGTVVPGVSTIASPVFDAFGDLAGSIPLLGREQDLSLSPTGSQLAALRKTSKRISQLLGSDC